MRKQFNMNFIGHSKLFFGISAVLIAATVILSFIIGVQFDLEFKGGTLLTYSYTGEIDTGAIEDTVESVSGETVTVTTGTSYGSVTVQTVSISFTSEEGLTIERQAAITDAVQAAFPENTLTLESSDDVNPSTGQEFFQKCLLAVAIAAILIIIYIGFRFRKIGGISAGVMGVVALVHDVIMVYLAFVIFQFPINMNFMAVILTILGYSINDTIVIYDRVRENEDIYGKKMPIGDMVNLSLNQTFTRCINTAAMTILTMIVVTIVALAFNVESIITFSLPMLVGMLSGTYSTLCIACPLWVVWKKHSDRKGGGSKKLNPAKA